MEVHRENKLHIGFFGRCNVGKSSLINFLTGQNTSIVSATSGTTTDTVKKTIELYNIGPTVLIDTAGIDDKGELSKERIKKTMEVFSLINLAVIVMSENIFSEYEKNLISQCERFSLPYIVIYNKQDIYPIDEKILSEVVGIAKNLVVISVKDKFAKEQLTLAIKDKLISVEKPKEPVLNSIVKEKDLILLVTPIDTSAPKGRLILPQVNMIRQVLDNNAVTMVVQPSELEFTLKNLKDFKPKLVITDSQVFDYVSKIVPKSIFLTSFSVLLAKQKGNFERYLQGVSVLDNLSDGDKVLMLESCTHQPTCEDIGRVKLPALIKKYTGKDICCSVLPGLSSAMEKDLDYKLVIQCGGCVATDKQLNSRLIPFIEKNIPVTNYGLAIAYMNGILKRAVKIFKK